MPSAKRGYRNGKLSPVATDIFIEPCEEVALDTADHKPTKWLRYVDDAFMVWPREPARLQQFLHHLNSVKPIIQFTMDVVANDTVLGRFGYE
jgi:hypothetical protein